MTDTQEDFSIMFEPISTLEISDRIIDRLREHRIFFIGELVMRSAGALLCCPGIGQKSAVEIKRALSFKGLKLNTPMPHEVGEKMRANGKTRYNYNKPSSADAKKQ